MREHLSPLVTVLLVGASAIPSSRLAVNRKRHLKVLTPATRFTGAAIQVCQRRAASGYRHGRNFFICGNQTITAAVQTMV